MQAQVAIVEDNPITVRSLLKKQQNWASLPGHGGKILRKENLWPFPMDVQSMRRLSSVSTSRERRLPR